MRGSFVCFCLEICGGGIVWVLLDFVWFLGWFFFKVGMLDMSSLVYSKQSNVLLWEFYLVLLQVHPVPSNKTVRIMRTKFLMLSVICLLVEILSFTYRIFSYFFTHKTLILVVCFRLMLSSCP